MVISSKIAEELTKEQLELIAQIESVVDNWLQRKYSSDSEVRDQFDNFAHRDRIMSEKVLLELTARYRKAGWAEAEFKWPNHTFLTVRLKK